MTKKIERTTEITNTFSEIIEEVLENPNTFWNRFDYKQAWYTDYIKTSTGTYRLLKSYSTIVALIDIDRNAFYELGKWSSTTSKQVTQFYNRYHAYCDRFLLV